MARVALACICWFEPSVFKELRPSRAPLAGPFTSCSCSGTFTPLNLSCSLTHIDVFCKAPCLPYLSVQLQKELCGPCSSPL